MKIKSIETFLMQAGTPDDRWWATDAGGQQSARNWLFVKVVTDEGIVGIGECSGWPRVIETAVNDLATVLIDEDPFDIERLWQRMYVAMMGHGMTGTVGSGAITGIDMALWDIKGKALGVPVWQLLGGLVRDRIKIYGHANTPEAARHLLDMGVTAVKTGSVVEPVRRVAAIRGELGGAVDVMVDLHGPPWMTAADAARTAVDLEEFDILFLEDPVAPENVPGFRQVREKTSVPLAAGERVATIWGARELLESGLIDVYQPDTGRSGGITQMKKLAAMAESRFITLAPHSGSLGPVAEYAALHVMASIPNALMLERIVVDWPGRYEVANPPPTQVDGTLVVPDAPGLGVEIDEEAILKYPSTHNIAITGGGYVPGTESETVFFQARNPWASDR
ncbi:MAG: galactonate dehydratase [Acidimicrobiia bacterium]|nr:MAG: galactonate dehydratase [Acidimicrobiia bacterium]